MEAESRCVKRLVLEFTCVLLCLLESTAVKFVIRLTINLF